MTAPMSREECFICGAPEDSDNPLSIDVHGAAWCARGCDGLNTEPRPGEVLSDAYDPSRTAFADADRREREGGAR